MDKLFMGGLAALLIGWIFTAWYLNEQISKLENLNRDLEIKLEAKQLEKANFEAALNLQNAKLQEYKTDVKNAKKTLAGKNQEINKKYKHIKAAADGCEASLAQIEKITEAFYGKDD